MISVHWHSRGVYFQKARVASSRYCAGLFDSFSFHSAIPYSNLQAHPPIGRALYGIAWTFLHLCFMNVEINTLYYNAPCYSALRPSPRAYIFRVRLSLENSIIGRSIGDRFALSFSRPISRDPLLRTFNVFSAQTPFDFCLFIDIRGCELFARCKIHTES